MVKIGKYILSAVLSTALLIMTSSCSRKPDYELTREVVQDEETGESYELIRNPAEPLYGEMGSAAKILEIGDPAGLATDADGNYIIQEGADENYIFAGIRDVSFKDGKIYVADKLDENIRVFDAYGDYQATFGRKGRGPGEFSRIHKIYVDDNGFLYVFEWNHSLHVFNNDHEFQEPKYRIRSLVKGLTEVYDIASIDSENFLLHCSFRLAFSFARIAFDNKNEDLFVRLNKDGEWFSFGPNRGYPGFEKDIESLKRETPPRSGTDYDLYFSNILSFKNMFLDQKDELLYSSTKAFPSRVVVRSSDDGRILRIIEKSIAENGPSFITQEVDRKDLISGPIVPLHQRFSRTDNSVTLFFIREEGIGIFADDANIYNVYRRLSKDGDNLRAQYFMDVFDLDGTYKQRVPLDMEIGSNFAGMDDEGNMVVFRKNPWPVVEKYQLGGIEK